MAKEILAMGRVLKIAGVVMGVTLLMMVGVMAAGRHGKEGPQLILMTYKDGDQAMLGWITPDFQHMRPLGRLCGELNEWVRKPDENWLYALECPKRGEIFAWTVKRIHVISGAEDVIAIRMVPYGGNWSPDYRWFVFQERKNAHDDRDLEVEWIRVAPDGTQRLVLTEDVPAVFQHSEEVRVFSAPDSEWIQIVTARLPDEQADVYRIRVDGTAWANLTANVDDLTDWYRSRAVRHDLNISREVIEAARARGLSNPSASPVCLPGDVHRVVAELPSKHLKIVYTGSYSMRGISTLDGSILWEVPSRDRVWVSPNEEWVLLGTEYFLVRDKLRWDGSDHHFINPPLYFPHIWSQDSRSLIALSWDVPSQQTLIKRMDIDSGTIETLFASTVTPELIARSPDGQVFYFTVNDHYTKTFALYAMRFDGSGLTRIKMLDPFAVDHIERFVPSVSHDWQPAILAAAGIGMGGVIFISDRVGRRKRKGKF